MGGFGPFAQMRRHGRPGFGMPASAGPACGGSRMDGPGMRGHGPGGPGGGLLAGAVLKTSATFLGISVADLQADLKGGKTLAQEATAKGKKPADLIAALTKDAKENLDAAVAAGWLTQKQADAVLERATDAITELVNNGPPVPPEKQPARSTRPRRTSGCPSPTCRTALKGGKTLAQVGGRPEEDGRRPRRGADRRREDESRQGSDRRQDHAGPGDGDPEQADRARHRHGQRRARAEGRGDDARTRIKHALRFTVRR